MAQVPTVLFLLGITNSQQSLQISEPYLFLSIMSQELTDITENLHKSMCMSRAKKGQSKVVLELCVLKWNNYPYLVFLSQHLSLPSCTIQLLKELALCSDSWSQRYCLCCLLEIFFHLTPPGVRRRNELGCVWVLLLVQSVSAWAASQRDCHMSPSLMGPPLGE